MIVDKHCIGGVPGNRTTMIVVPMLAAAGLTVPKTSSRSITSPAGTADTMEVLCPVSIDVKKMKKIVKKANACMVWGGGPMNLAAADDKLIKIRHPLSLDPEGMLLASILAKKAAVGATIVLIDIPLGKQTKIKTKKQARRLKKKFVAIGKKLGMRVKVVVTDGSKPIGNGIGPALEARDVLWLLRGDPRAPRDLRAKSLHVASVMMEMAGIKNPLETAHVMLETRLAYKKMQEIIKLQGGNPNIDPDKIPLGKFTHDIKADKTGIIDSINNKTISKIARVAGAPEDKGAGLYLHKTVGHRVAEGDVLFTIYAESEQKLGYALHILELMDGIVII